MTTLTLISEQNLPLRTVVESALAAEAHSLEEGLRRTQERLRDFEENSGLSTTEFIERYSRNEIEETLETIEWLGEYRMYVYIQEKLDTLKGIRVAISL